MTKMAPLTALLHKLARATRRPCARQCGAVMPAEPRALALASRHQVRPSMVGRIGALTLLMALMAGCAVFNPYVVPNDPALVSSVTPTAAW